MVASKAMFEAVIGKAREAANEIQPTADWVCKALEETYCSDVRYLVDPFAGLPGINLCPSVKLAISEFYRILDEYLPKLFLALTYLEAVPLFMYEAGAQWTDIQQLAAKVQDSTDALSQLTVMGVWEGGAGQAYSTGVKDQPIAAQAISSTAGTISGACEEFFEAAFGATLGIVVGLGIFIASLPPAIPSAGSSLVPAVAGLVGACVSALGGLAFQTFGPEQQLKGAVPIPNMPGGNLSTAGGWPSATQGS